MDKNWTLRNDMIEDIKPEELSAGYLWYNPVTDRYLMAEYLVNPSDFTKFWRFGWIENPVITTWVSLVTEDDEDSEKLCEFLQEHEDTKLGMFIPFTSKRIDGNIRILVDHILGERFTIADIDEIQGIYV